MTLKKVLFAAFVAVAATGLAASDSYAFGLRHGCYGCWGGGCRGSWVSCGCWGGCSCNGCWGGRCWGGRRCGGWGCRGCWGGCSCNGCWGGCVAPGNCCGVIVCNGCTASNTVVYGGYAAANSVGTNVVVASAPTVKTRLTLRVPAEAKVTLAGVETKQTGEVRQFATSKLAAGQTWDDYKVVVEMTRDGKTVRQERNVKLIGGRDQELAVNFDSNSAQQVAQLTR